jgi:hypothetical protein
MIEQIINKNRRLRLEYNFVKNSCDNLENEIFYILNNYLKEFCEYFNLEAEDVIQMHNEFIGNYLNDIKLFLNNGKYPYQLSSVKHIDRISYDVTLLLSVFLSRVRLQIFKLLIESLKKKQGEVIIVGVGAALELELISKLIPNLKFKAFDLSISDFVCNRFGGDKVFEREFVFEKEKGYETIIFIELLEHLEAPYSFLKKSSEFLLDGGNIICTTSSNMPQFDHFYNFHNDNFEEKLKEFNLNVKTNIKLPHNLINSKIDSYNNFYELQKNHSYVVG